MLLVAFSAIAALASSSSSSSSSSSMPTCNIVKMSEQYLHNLQAGSYKDLHAMYSRTALRYDNGALSRFTGGKPWTVAQSTCVAERLTSAIEVTHFTRDWTHRSSSLAMKVTFGTEAPLDMLVNLEFNRHDCTIENEHYYYATEHPGFDYLVSKTIDDCWGDEVDVRGPIDNVLAARNCWSYVIDGSDVGRFMRCFSSETVWTINGMPAPAEFWDSAYWEAVFRTIDIDSDATTVEIVQDRSAGVVLSLVEGMYKVAAGGPSYPFSIGLKQVVENGNVISFTEVIDERQFGPWFAAVAREYGRSGPVPVSDLAWTHAEAKYQYSVISSFFSAPVAVWPQGDGTGQAVFMGEANVAGEMILGCLSNIIVEDEALLANPVLPTDEPRHFEMVYANLPFAVSEASRLDVQKVSRSVVYDAVNGVLMARGGSIQGVVVTLALSKQVATGRLTVQEAQNLLGPSIVDSVKVDSNGIVTKYKSSFYDFAMEVCK